MAESKLIANVKTSIPPHKKRSQDLVERISDAVLLRRPIAMMGHWIQRKLLKVDGYLLQGNFVIPHQRRVSRFDLGEIASWRQVFIGFGISFIVVHFADGRVGEFSDQYEALLCILQKTIPEKELPWTAV